MMTASFPSTRSGAGLVMALAALALTGCSLAGDVTPPPGVAAGVQPVAPRADAPAPVGAAVSAASFPSAAPSLVQGAVVYADHCAACHGPTGRGDGEKSDELKAQLTDPIPDFSTPARLNPRTPGELYQTVTQGRLDKLMPPFGESLTDAERWSAVAFLYTLSAPDPLMEQGRGIFEGQCASCHTAGATASTDGPPATDFTDQAYMSGQSQDALVAALAVHEPPLDQALSAEDAIAVSVHERRLSFSDEPVSLAQTQAGAPPAAEAGVVSGRVSQGTQGAALPKDLEIVLRGYDDFSQAVMLTTTVGSDGSFAFEDVPSVAGRQFMLTSDYAGLSYGSDIFNFEAGREVSGLAMTVYEGTTDTSSLRIERLHIAVVDSGNGGPLTVSELVLFANLGDRTISAPGDADIEVPLPQDATAVVVQGLVEGSDYIRTADGLGLLLPIRPGPGSAQLTVSFQLPAGSVIDFNQRVAFPVQALDVMASESLALTSAGLQDRGLQTLQESTVHAYGGGDLTSGDLIAFTLTSTAGGPLVGGAGAWSLASQDLALIGAVVVVAAVAIGVILWRRRAGRAIDAEALGDDEALDPEILLQAIADLDDDFADGAVTQQAYQRERTRLKAQLVALTSPNPVTS